MISEIHPDKESINPSKQQVYVIGLEIHELPFILRGNNIKLQAGMTFSIEPMIVVPEEFGVRLEDHVYMTNEGPRWFTEPAHSIENPFGV